MANVYANTPVLAKVKIGNEIYWLKDADVRAILDTYKGAVKYDVDTTFAADSENLATSKAIAAYISDEIKDLAGAMHFIGVVEALPEEAAAGDIVILKDTTTEYVYDGDKWVELGDEGNHATKTYVQNNFVQKTFTIANIDMQDNITADELKTALGLAALAYKDSASATLNDYATGINGTDYTPAGSVEVKLTHASTKVESEGTFTPAGTISGNVTAAGTVSIARDDANGTAVSGTVSAPAITVTPTTAQVQHINSVGTLPSYTAAQYTAPSVTESSAQFAKAGLVAAMDDTDTEMLVFTAAATDAALVTTGFNAGSYTAAEFDAGALPVLGNAQTVVTGIEKAEATAPTFTGDKFGATFAGSQVAISADFTGTEGNVAVSGNYDKAGVESATFAGTEATITPELVVGNKTITVQ
jgi:hypothetical protein